MTSLGLCIDTSHTIGSVALFEDGRELGSLEIPTTFKQSISAALAPSVEALMEKSGKPLSALTEILVNKGPGSFTGLRSGAAFAQGLALAAGVPLYGLTSFEALEAQIEEKNSGRTLFLIDTRCHSFYVGYRTADGAFEHKIVEEGPELDRLMQEFERRVCDREISSALKEGLSLEQQSSKASGLGRGFYHGVSPTARASFLFSDLFYLKDPL